MQAGSYLAEFADDTDEFTITFPVAFSDNPIIFLQVATGSSDNDEYRWIASIRHGSISQTGFSFRTIYTVGPPSTEQSDLPIFWLAIGPE